ncbi:MAG TPA: hypothetical protein VFG14_12860 [Chthoniobacteraceae bacterium]|nr:hypothetical protein [Chthoniobacteraceae bacterium]
MHAALAITDRSKRERALASIAENLDVAEIRAALDKLTASRLPERREIIAQLLARWADLEPLAALKFAQGAPRRTDREQCVNAVLNAWLEVDASAAEAFVRALPTGSLRNAAWQTLILSVAATDCSRAVSLVEESRLQWDVAVNLAAPIFSAWAATDPESAAARAGQLEQGMFRTEAQNIIATQWAESNPEAALEWALALPDRLMPGMQPGGRGTTVSGAERTNTVSRILETWIMRDGAAAVRWLNLVDDGPWKRMMISVASEKNGSEGFDPRVAVQLAAMLPEGEWREESLFRSSAGIAMHDPKAGLALLSHETNAQSRQTIMDGLVRWLTGDNLIAALEQMPQSAAAGKISNVWADPETAARWFAQRRHAEAYLAASAGVWLVKDPAQAEDFIRTLSQTMRDQVYTRAVQDPMYGETQKGERFVARLEQIAEWIPAISDPGLREKTYLQHAERWLRVDTESARRWIESLPISAEHRQKLLKPGT